MRVKIKIKVVDGVEKVFAVDSGETDGFLVEEIAEYLDDSIVGVTGNRFETMQIYATMITFHGEGDGDKAEKLLAAAREYLDSKEWEQ